MLKPADDCATARDLASARRLASACNSALDTQFGGNPPDSGLASAAVAPRTEGSAIMVDDLTQSVQPPTTTERPATDPPAGPPGFELLDEIGRGGMGVVY